MAGRPLRIPRSALAIITRRAIPPTIIHQGIASPESQSAVPSCDWSGQKIRGHPAMIKYATTVDDRPPRPGQPRSLEVFHCGTRARSLRLITDPLWHEGPSWQVLPARGSSSPLTSNTLRAAKHNGLPQVGKQFRSFRLSSQALDPCGWPPGCPLVSSKCLLGAVRFDEVLNRLQVREGRGSPLCLPAVAVVKVDPYLKCHDCAIGEAASMHL